MGGFYSLYTINNKPTKLIIFVKNYTNMIYSMTGYGKATIELPNRKVTIEIKSLNSKQFDLYTRIPLIYRDKEISIRNYLAKRIGRGKVDLSFNLERISKDVTSKIDHSVIKQYFTDIKELSDELKVDPPSDWLSTLIRLPEVMKQDIEEIDEEEWKQIEKTISNATDDLMNFRAQEGAVTQSFLKERIETIRTLLIEIEPYELQRLEKIKTRIIDNLSQLEGIEYDNNRFEQEMIFYVEKLDINEEKLRLNNHLDYFISTMDKDNSQGKKLGFITQEIGREINTLGSKSNDFDMQRIVVQMKDELEQIKEQILNIL